MTPTALDDPRAVWRPSPVGFGARAVVLAGLAVLAIALPNLVPPETVNVVSRMFTFGVIALSMNVLIGYAGQVSLGHQAFIGVGAFVSGYLITEQQLPWLFAAVGAIVIGALTSLLLGAIALRVRGLFFALVTVAYGLFAENSVFKIEALTGGGAGQQAARPAFAMSDVRYAYVCLAGLLLAWVFDWRFTSSRAGRAVQALRDDERVAASWGIDVTQHKLLAFSISGAIAGLGGAQFASIEQIISPVSFDFTLALTIVLMTVVGGVGSRPGVVIGGFVFATLATLLDAAHLAWGGVEEIALACTSAPPRIIQAVVGLTIIAPVAERFVHWVRGQQEWTAARGVLFGGGFALGVIALLSIGFSPLRWVSLALALALVVVVVRSSRAGSYLGWGLGLGTALTSGGWLVLTSITRGYCIWTTIDFRFVSLIGAILLLATLIQFPGGIAEQFGPVFRWLSFKRFGSGDDTDVGGEEAGGGMGSVT